MSGPLDPPFPHDIPRRDAPPGSGSGPRRKVVARARRLVGRLLTALLLLCTVAVGAGSIGWVLWRSGTTGSRGRLLDGAVLAVSLLFLVAVVHTLYRLAPRFAPLVALLLGLQACLVPAATPMPFPANDLAHRSAQVILCLLLASLLGKVVLLHRYAGKAYHRSSQVPQKLFPSRRRSVDQIRALVRSPQRGGRVVPITGRWGEGKSFVLHELARDWGAGPSWSPRDPDAATGRRPAFVRVDVWQIENDGDLQVSLIDTLLAHPAHLRRYRWLRIPARFLAAQFTAAVRSSLRTVQLKLVTGRTRTMEVAAELAMPRLDWQWLLERITQTTAAAGTVIALDEVDRATPAAAQAALTLARRSTNLNGVTILIPYIREQIRYKIFNPLQATLPDIAATMYAVVYDDLLRRPLPSRPDPSAPGSQGAPGSVERLLAPLHRDGVPTPWSPQGAALPAQLAELFTRLDLSRRDFLQDLFEEKYLGPAGITLDPLSAEDLMAMVTGESDLTGHLQVLIGPTPLRPTGPDGSPDPRVARLREVITTGARGLGDRARPGPTRRVHEMLVRVLSAAARNLAQAQGEDAASGSEAPGDDEFWRTVLVTTVVLVTAYASALDNDPVSGGSDAR